jgi:CCR4-NOT transcription complex subunit 6
VHLRFKRLESHCINFDVLENDPLIKPVKRTYTFRTNNIASLVLLERLDHGEEKIPDSQRFLWVISAHLFWNPSVPTVKLLQAKFLLDETRRIQAGWQKRRLSQSAPTGRFEAPVRPHNDIGVSDISSPLLAQTRYIGALEDVRTPNLLPSELGFDISGPHMPVIFCGDLNSTPDSAVYAIIKNGSVPKADLAARKFPLIDWQQPFRTLKSAYEHSGEPMTNITENFSGCLDYIWFDSANVAVTKVLQNPTQEASCSNNIQEYGFLPSPTHPSDHLPLVAEIAFIKTQQP